ncbi:sensor histidine kinase [Gordonia sp. 852002-10350_SCH5691597]|uniref:sensor histidine kinase n=1 Tax=Gordonia sp. 852002-10350_SCH5691597 TaxID=1834085 RepID=UPI000AFAAAA6|nr:histidine kinase [Gordonia sp. 852002-10350_SCH5691597]
MSDGVAVLIAVLAIAAIAMVAVLLRTRRVVATPTERAVHSTLNTASRAARPLRRGLTTESAQEALGPLRTLTATDAIALYDADGTRLARDEPHIWDERLLSRANDIAATAGEELRHVLLRDPVGVDARIRALIAQPLVVDDVAVGVLVVASVRLPGPGMLSAISEVARYASSQLELADLDASRARLDRAEVLALRAQISPHFIYNALSTIASFVRTDPDRARELILDFADFTRYSFRAAGEYTVLADELRNIDRYLTLERARFGSALDVRLQVAPEVLGVVLPFLALQPLVENAVRHGVAARGGGTISIVARDEGTDCVIAVEDDGVGMDPELLRSGAIDALDATSTEPTEETSGARVGLTNVDHRLRAAFGNNYGLVVETGVGAGTKVSMRVPKFRAGVRVEQSPTHPATPTQEANPR